MIEKAVVAALDAGKAERAGKGASVPKTRRGLAKFAQTTTKDITIVAAIKSGKTYREIVEELGVGLGTVSRVAKAYGLTGHALDVVPLSGTLEENLSVR